MIDRRLMLAQMALAATAGDAVFRPVEAGQSLSAAGGVLGAGEHQVPASLTVTGDLLLLPGARINVAAGATLTVQGDFHAPIGPVFTGSGRIDLNGSRAPAAYPEWWGARTNDGAFDNRPMLEACVSAHPITQLACADYFIADSWAITRAHRAVRGVDAHWSGPGSATRIVVARARAGTADVIRIGPDAGEERVFKVRLANLHLTRDGAVRPPVGGRPGDGPAGLRLRFCQEVLVEDVVADNNATGFYLGGVVHSYLKRCVAARTLPGRGGGEDRAFGFVLDGDAPGGFAGGNASVYLEDCTAVGAGSRAATHTIAALLLGAFADSYLTRFECSACVYGIRLEGLGAGNSSPRGKTGNADVHLILPILDQCGQAGIEIARLSDYGLVDIVSPYVAPATGALAAIHIHDGAGLVTVTGGQLIGYGDAEGGGNAIGVHVVNASGLTTRGLKILGFRRPFGLTDCRGFDVEAAINNPAQRASQAAVQLAECDHGSVRALVTGGTGVFPQGVRLDGQANNRIAVDVTGVDPTAVAGGAANKLVWDRLPVRAPGPFGTNLASGVMV